MTYSLQNKKISQTYGFLLQTRNGEYYDGYGNQIIISASSSQYNIGYGLTANNNTISIDTNNVVDINKLLSYNYVTASIVNGYLTQSALVNYVTTANLLSYNYVTASIINGYLTQSALVNYVTTANLLSYNYVTASIVNGYLTQSALQSYFTNGGNSFGLTATFGTIDNQNLQINLNNTLAVRFLTQSANVTTGPGSSVVAFMANTATASGYPNPLGVSNVWIQGISTMAANTSLLTTYNSGSGSGLNRPHIRLINGAGQSVWVGMQDNSQNFIIGRSTETFFNMGAGGTVFTMQASGAAQNSVVINASHQNSSGVSTALLITNTGGNSSTGGVTTFRINNTETLNGSGLMSLMEAQRNSNTVFRIDMSGGISAGTVSNATASTWKLGKPITASASLNTNQIIEISIDGTIYKLALIL